MTEIIPTVVPSTIDDVAMLLARCRAFSQTFHIDAADGSLAPNTTWMPAADQKLPEADTIFYEAHLMVAHPLTAGNAFAQAGAKRIIVHAESLGSEADAKNTFEVWKKNGAKEIGLGLLLKTPLEALDPYIYLSDSVTLMSIATVGTQGIPFNDHAYVRVADLHARYPELMIDVDGGVGKEQIQALARAGARRFSVGSAIAKSADPEATYKELQAIAGSAL